ncbi:MAG: hypothetical protein V3W18_14395 [candidate division Zixibacteria bacterium]
MTSSVFATDALPNGTFDTDISGWTVDITGPDGTRQWDDVVFGNASGSIRYRTLSGSRQEYRLTDSSSTTFSVNSTDSVTLAFYWYKTATDLGANRADMTVDLFLPSGASQQIWNDTQAPSGGQVIDGNYPTTDISSLCTETGIYKIQLVIRISTERNSTGYVQANFDDILLDVVSGAVNNPPTVVAGATQVVPDTVNRYSTNTTVISTDFTDTDVPGIGAFNVTFRIREPNDITELTLVNNQPNGGGGLTIADNGGGSYTASYTYNPDDAQILGPYDLYFEVTDDTDNATDNYIDNTDELEIIEVLPNNAPTVVAGATQVVPDTVNRFGSNTTVISTDFNDTDQPGVGAFNATFRIREFDDITELTLVNNQPNGGGGLTITDNGGGSYTASYTYNPDDAQTLGSYDLYFEVTDGTDNAIDNYADNLNELEIEEVLPNSAPTVVAGATQVVPDTVNRFGSNTTAISTDFNDTDQPGVGAFNVTFKIREFNDITELTLVNNQPNGGGGLTITDNGGGSYTASYTYNPDDAQTLGSYDLYFEITDGVDSVIDDYADNPDELEIVEIIANDAPTVVAGTTQVVPDTVNRFGSNTTVISTDFTDIDQPGVGAFNATFRIREFDDITELTLVNNQPNGGGGLTITDHGGGSYTASYSYNPDDAQTLGSYDLYFEVTDGVDTAIDDYADNLNELEIIELIVNDPPTVATGATYVNPIQVNRLGSNTTTIATIFNDTDEPGVGAFNVTFKIREPDNIAELTLVNNQPNGSGGLTITDNGGGSYTARYTYNPNDAQTMGFYDLYFEVTDGYDTAIDIYDDNLNELEIIEIIANNPPLITAGNTAVNPTSLDRFGPGTTEFSVTFTDADEPGVSGFFVTFKTRSPYNQFIYLAADALQHGVGGMTITDGGGGSYTATIFWDPPDNTNLGYHDLYCEISDGTDAAVDNFADNIDELLISNGGENAPPVVPADNAFASPAAVERIGTNPTTISATFTDTDIPGVTVFRVSFKLRLPDNSAELILADSVANGQSGVTISDDGGGIYTASVSWDPPDAQTLGFYDLYFQVDDGVDISYDNYFNNLDEFEIYDAISNNAPTIVADTTFAIPTSVNRIGSEYTMIKSTFTDIDMPGRGAFTVTIAVRDQSSIEDILVNAANHGEQGLRIENRPGGVYEATVLWYPADAQATGTYDLYFYVEDNYAAATVDGYSNNADELTVTSTAILGDGNLLRRTNDSGNCGGPNSACHAIANHQTFECLTCHTPHNTTNIYMVRDTIQTPSSGNREVIFKTLGIGDAFNDPDPVAGDPTSGVMADSSDGVFTGVCEVCHRTTTHHTNDGIGQDSTQLPAVHNDAVDCTSCHPHDGGFSPSGGGESSGGQACACHGSIFNPMNSSTDSYHHQIDSNSPVYTLSSKTCLTCHVDHDIFRPDLNPGIGARSRNLRVDITSSVDSGDVTVLANSDYSSSGTGGICLSCHTSTQTKYSNPPDGSTETQPISKTDFDAATSTHNYSATSTFNSDASTFNGNCVKCHNDTMTKSYQSAGNKFSAHDNPYGRILNPLGAPSPADPMEEKLCFGCHSTTQNPNAGTNQDYYGVQSMSDSALAIQTVFGYTYGHPTTDSSGLHSPGETGPDFADGNRHAECQDCHNVHAAQQGTHDGTSNLVSNALKGTWGVEPDTGWPDPQVPSNNANVFTAPAPGDFIRVEPAVREWQICLKCHSNYTTLPSGNRNLAEEINPKYPSTHGIVEAGKNSYCNTTTMFEPWGSANEAASGPNSGIVYCSDCHSDSSSAGPSGPHGSNAEHLLVATIVSDDQVGTPLCDVCHNPYTYWSGNAIASRYGQHPASRGGHQKPKGCFTCHMWDYAWTSGLGVQTSEVFTDGPVFVHGQNKRWRFMDDDGTDGSYDPVDAFINGYLANIDYSVPSCWSDEDATGCSRSHNATTY